MGIPVPAPQLIWYAGDWQKKINRQKGKPGVFFAT